MNTKLNKNYDNLYNAYHSYTMSYTTQKPYNESNIACNKYTPVSIYTVKNM